LFLKKIAIFEKSLYNLAWKTTDRRAGVMAPQRWLALFHSPPIATNACGARSSRPGFVRCEVFTSNAGGARPAPAASFLWNSNDAVETSGDFFVQCRFRLLELDDRASPSVAAEEMNCRPKNLFAS
jgi:hypothetical protein